MTDLSDAAGSHMKREQHLRWMVEIDYRTEHGTVTVDHLIEEIEELDGIIERGPDWNTIVQMRIVLNPRLRSHSGTVEDHPR